MLSELLKGLIVDPYTPVKNQICLINGMLNFEDLSSDGWQLTETIMHKGKFKSQINNIYNYLNEFIERGIVEKRKFEYQDDRKRKHHKIQYRLIPRLNTYQTLYFWRKNNGCNLPELNTTTFFELLCNQEGLDEIESEKERVKAIDLFLLKDKEEELAKELSQIQDQIKKLNGGVKR